MGHRAFVRAEGVIARFVGIKVFTVLKIDGESGSKIDVQLQIRMRRGPICYR